MSTDNRLWIFLFKVWELKPQGLKVRKTVTLRLYDLVNFNFKFKSHVRVPLRERLFNVGLFFAGIIETSLLSLDFCQKNFSGFQILKFYFGIILLQNFIIFTIKTLQNNCIFAIIL